MKGQQMNHEEGVKVISLKIDLDEEQYEAFMFALEDYRSQREVGKTALLQFLRDNEYLQDDEAEYTFDQWTQGEDY